MKNLPSMCLAAILCLAYAGCKESVPPHDPHFERLNVELIEATESESGHRELVMHIAFLNPHKELIFRFEAAPSARLEGVWHFSDHAIIRFVDDAHEYRFDYDDLIERAETPDPKTLRDLTEFKRQNEKLVAPSNGDDAAK